MRPFLFSIAVLGAWTVALCGCRLFDDMSLADVEAKSPLRPVSPSPDSAAVEIFIARMPADEALHDELWQQMDEQTLPTDLRRRLSQNGFRAGVVGGTVPDALARVLQLREPTAGGGGGDVEDREWEPNAATGDEPEAETGTKRDGDPSFKPDLASDNALTRQWRRLRSGQRAEINVSDRYATLPILLRDESGLRGQTYDDVQGVYAVRATPQPRGEVRFEVVPELHHGRPRTRYTGGEGPYWRMEVARDREVLEDFRIPANLRPGEMLVIGEGPAAGGSLGHHFHRVAAEKGAGRRLIVIRLAQSPDDSLSPPERGL